MPSAIASLLAWRLLHEADRWEPAILAAELCRLPKAEQMAVNDRLLESLRTHPGRFSLDQVTALQATIRRRRAP